MASPQLECENAKITIAETIKWDELEVGDIIIL